MKLVAKITPNKASLIATLDPAVIGQAKMNLYELAQKNGFVGSFDDFLAQFKMADIATLISTDLSNTLALGQDHKLFINLLTKQDW